MIINTGDICHNLYVMVFDQITPYLILGGGTICDTGGKKGRREEEKEGKHKTLF